MRISITGAKGQLGRELVAQLGPTHDIQALDSPQFDIVDPQAILALVSFSPDVVIHAAACTDVDGCELNPAQAKAVNVDGTRNVALACREAKAAMIYLSTNYVFDGSKTEPYLEDDPIAPLSVYGRSKADGEEQVRSVLERFCIVRTAWLYTPGGRNFVETMLRLAEKQDTLRVVADQFGSPTYAPDLAAAVGGLIVQGGQGIYHLTNSGSCSWHQWAEAVMRQAGMAEIKVVPIPAAEYPRPATPPRNGVIANRHGASQGITLRPWEEGLQDFFRRRAG
jgi:dTDP-4-dehydrorhamnose reductase